MKYFILGLGITGISTVKTLSSLGKKVVVFDDNLRDSKKIEDELKGFNYEIIQNPEDIIFKDIDIVVKSPGISLNNDLLNEFRDNNVEIISDLELSYRLFPNKKLVSLTGTNGKTTTTMLLTHILRSAGKKAIAIGNIGVGMLWEIYNNKDIEYFIIECSSFQLASVNTFRTNVAGIINITQDHIDWHKSFENYIKDKSNIFKNQDHKDILVINSDDRIINDISKNIKPKLVKTSMEKELDNGFYSIDDNIYYSDNGIREFILKRDDFKIVGNHNIENALIAMGMAYSLNITLEQIGEACKKFKPVSHRIEFVREYKNVKFYNDSKGSNIDATKKAIESFDDPLILIAGGYDKKVSFDELFNQGYKNIKALILFGETKNLIKNTAEKYEYNNIYIVENMREAIDKSYEIMEGGDVVLLSPASASWGMYRDYIERGEDFINIVNELGD